MFWFCDGKSLSTLQRSVTFEFLLDENGSLAAAARGEAAAWVGQWQQHLRASFESGWQTTFSTQVLIESRGYSHEQLEPFALGWGCRISSAPKQQFSHGKANIGKRPDFFLLDLHAKISSFIILSSFVAKPKPLLAEASIVRLFMAFLKSLLKLDGDRHFWLFRQSLASCCCRCWDWLAFFLNRLQQQRQPRRSLS